MEAIPKLLITVGALILAVGLLWSFFGKYIPIGKLPGDISVEKKNFRFYFPITTSIILSIVLTLIFWAIHYFRS